VQCLFSERRQSKVSGVIRPAPATIRRAHKVHPISALQLNIHYGHVTRKQKFLMYVKNLELLLVAYSPLGRGFLSGRFKNSKDCAPEDDSGVIIRDSVMRILRII